MSLTRTERNDLVTLARRRARVAANDAKARAAGLKAQVEESLAREFSAQDERWREEVEAAHAQVSEIQARITAKLKEEGVPEEFHPRVAMRWASRGANSVNERRVELRRVATTRIDEMLKRAVAEIERTTVNTETELLLATSGDKAREYLANLPTPESLLPDTAAPTVVAELMASKQEEPR